MSDAAAEFAKLKTLHAAAVLLQEGGHLAAVSLPGGLAGFSREPSRPICRFNSLQGSIW